MRQIYTQIIMTLTAMLSSAAVTAANGNTFRAMRDGGSSGKITYTLKQPDGTVIKTWTADKPAAGSRLDKAALGDQARDYCTYTFTDNDTHTTVTTVTSQLKNVDVSYRFDGPFKTDGTLYYWIGREMVAPKYYGYTCELPYTEAPVPYKADGHKDQFPTFWWTFEGDPYTGFSLRNMEKPDLYLSDAATPTSSATTKGKVPELGTVPGKYLLLQSTRPGATDKVFALRLLHNTQLYLNHHGAASILSYYGRDTSDDGNQMGVREVTRKELLDYVKPYFQYKDCPFALTGSAVTANNALAQKILAGNADAISIDEYKQAIRLTASTANITPLQTGYYRLVNSSANTCMNASHKQGEIWADLSETDAQYEAGSIFLLKGNTQTYNKGEGYTMRSQGLYMSGYAMGAAQYGSTIVNRRQVNATITGSATNPPFLNNSNSKRVLTGSLNTKNSYWRIKPTTGEGFTGLKVKMNKPTADDKSYSTIYVDFPAEVLTADTRLYRAGADGSKVVCKRIEGNAPIATGLLIRNTAGADVTELKPLTTAVAALAGSNLFKGVFFRTDKTAGNIRVFGQLKDGTAGFAKNKNTYLKPNRAYFETTTSAGAKVAEFSLSFEEDNNTTGITAISNDNVTQTDVVYDLQGRRVTHPSHGVYIVNGRKVVK